MISIKSMLLSLAMVFGTASLAVPSATAQGTKVIVIDSAKIIRDSKAGIDIRNKLKTLEEGMVSQLKPEEDTLRNELTALQTKAQGKTQQQVLADAALKSEMEALGRKDQAYARKRQIMAQELSLTGRKAWSDFRGALNPVLQEVVSEQGADLMIDRSNAVYAGAAIDVTATIISKLDAKTPTVNVQLQKLPTQPQ